MIDALSQFRDAIRATGLEPPEFIEPSKLYRFPGIGKRNGNTAGWCKLFDDGLGGCFGDWSSGFADNWQTKRDKPFTPAECAAFKRLVAEAKAQAEAERKAKKAEAAAQATAICNVPVSALEATQPAIADHQYLQRKNIQPHGVKIYYGSLTISDMACHGALMIPMKLNGKITSLQFINRDGEKRFLPGGEKGGFLIGKIEAGKPVCVCEGFATGASIHEATGHAVIVAFDAGNLKKIAAAVRAKNPDLRIIFCADVDESGTGQGKATEAALSVGGLLAIPDFGTGRPERATDFNDMAQLCGLEAVRRAVADASAPARREHQQEHAPAYARTVELIRGSDVTPEPVTWLWNGWLAAGKMHVLGGAPGTGKTTISMALAATVTTGGRWPDGSRSPVGTVVVWSGEDDPADTLIPRLLLSGANVNRVFFISDVIEGNERRSFDPAKDMEPLRRKLIEIGDVRLLIVDPIASAIAGDSHKNAEVRRGLQPLADLAASMRCALLGITHFSKGTGGRDPVERLTGSLAFGALARVVLVAAKHQEEGEDGRTARLFLRAKSNIGPDDGGFEYDLHQAELKTHPGIFSSSVLWGEAVEGAARELLATADATTDTDERDAIEDAKKFLRYLLANGPVPAKHVEADIRGAGYAPRTINRAKKLVGATSYKEGKTWFWRIEGNAQINQDCQPCQEILTRNHGNLGNVEPHSLVVVDI